MTPAPMTRTSDSAGTRALNSAPFAGMTRIRFLRSAARQPPSQSGQHRTPARDHQLSPVPAGVGPQPLVQTACRRGGRRLARARTATAGGRAVMTSGPNVVVVGGGLAGL